MVQQELYEQKYRITNKVLLDNGKEEFFMVSLVIDKKNKGFRIENDCGGTTFNFDVAKMTPKCGCIQKQYEKLRVIKDAITIAEKELK
jgi:hypothetical protein